MAKAFSEKECQIIRRELIETAKRLMAQKAMRKITVEEIITPCHIAKGSFYRFFDSKELLFWEVIMEWHDMLSNNILDKINISDEVSVESLTDLITSCYLRCFDMGLDMIFMNGEIDYLMRALPEEIIAEHMGKDDDMLSKLITMLPGVKEDQIPLYAAAFRGIFLFLIYKKEIGTDFEKVLRLTVRGIVIQILGGKEYDPCS